MFFERSIMNENSVCWSRQIHHYKRQNTLKYTSSLIFLHKWTFSLSALKFMHLEEMAIFEKRSCCYCTVRQEEDIFVRFFCCFSFRNVELCLFKTELQKLTRQVSSMIHSARPTVSPVVTIVFA